MQATKHMKFNGRILFEISQPTLGTINLKFLKCSLWILMFCILQACMFVNISPLESNMAETVSSLEFGQNARQVELGKATKHVTEGS